MTPERFSIDVCSRVAELLERMAPLAREARLTTTFALTLAMPLIVVPYERNSSGSDMNELAIDPAFAAHYAKLKQADFCSTFLQQSQQVFDWRFVEIKQSRAKGVFVNQPSTWRDKLGSHPLQPGAMNEIKEQSVGNVLQTMRHALSHATIVYLNRDGLERPNRDVTHLAFVARRSMKDTVNYRVLIVEEQEFVQFLRAWARILQQAPLGEALRLVA